MAEEDQNQVGIPDLIPASMLAAFAYCPRLCYLQFVQGEFQDSAEMVQFYPLLKSCGPVEKC